MRVSRSILPPAERRHSPFRRFTFEQLEERIALAVNLAEPIGGDFGNNFASAQNLGNPGQQFTVGGLVNVPFDLDMFSFQAPNLGPNENKLTVTQIAPAGSGLDSLVQVFNANGVLIAANDDATINGSFTLNSQLQAVVNPGETYFVAAGGYYTSTGAYELSLSFADIGDDYGDDTGSATGIVLDGSGSGGINGKIDFASDVDYFRFTATQTGLVQVHLDAAAGSSVDPILAAYDSGGVFLGVNDDSGGSLNSRIFFSVQAGDTYYLEAGSYGSTIGEYELSLVTLPPVPDDFGDTTGDATIVPLSNLDFGGVFGEIGIPTDVDMFQFTASQTGSAVIALSNTEVGGLDTLLTVFHAGGALIAQNDNINYFNGNLNSQVEIAVVAGQTYFVGAQASTFAFDDQEVGNYNLTIQVSNTPLDDFGNTIFQPQLLGMASNGTAVVNGSIEQFGDVDVFQLTTADGGLLQVSLTDFGNTGVDPRLTVYDAFGNFVASNDDVDFAGGNLNSQLQFLAGPGDTFFIDASAWNIGDYALSVETIQFEFQVNTNLTLNQLTDAGSGQHVAMSPAGRSVVVWTDDSFGDTDVWAQVYDQNGNPVGGNIWVANSLLNEEAPSVAMDDNGNFVVAWQQEFAAGLDWDIRARRYDANGNPLGASFVVATTFTDEIAPSVAMDSDGDFVVVWQRDDGVGSWDVYGRQYASDGTPGGLLQISANAAADEEHATVAMDPNGNFVVVWQENPFGDTNVIARRYAANGTSLGSVVVAVTIANEQNASVAVDNFGNFVVAFEHDSAGNFDVEALRFDSNGNFLGWSPVAGTSDDERFPSVGVDANGDFIVTYTQTDAGSGTNDVNALHFNVFGSPIGAAEVINQTLAGDQQFSSVAMDANGNSLIVWSGAGPFDASGVMGRYVDAADDYGNTFLDAQPLALATTPSGAQGVITGVIETFGDFDVFAFTAGVNGFATVTQMNAFLFGLDSYLLIFDGFGNFITVNDNIDFANFNLDSQVQFAVQTGQTYFIVSSASPAANVNESVGDYTLSVQIGTALPDEVGGTLADVYPLVMDTVDGTTGGIRASVNFPNDEDVYTFTAAVAGTYVITLQAAQESSLNALIGIFDAFGQFITANDDLSGTTTDAQIEIAAQAGETLVIVARGLGGSTGDYRLTVRPSPEDDFGDTNANAFPLAVGSDELSASASGTIEILGDRDVFAYTPTINGEVIVSQSAPFESMLDSVLTVFDGNGNQIATNNNNGFSADSQLGFAVVAGQTYFIHATAFGSSTGDYDLSIKPAPPDDFGDSFGDAQTLTVSASGAAGAMGTIEIGGDTDMFHITATVTGAMTITLSPTIGSTLFADDADWYVYDVNQNLIASKTDVGGAPLVINVAAGNEFFILVDPISPRSGTYDLAIKTSPSTDDFGNIIATAHALTLGPPGALGGISGNINVVGDVDFFSFTAAADGTAIIGQLEANSSGLDSFLTVLDSLGNVITVDDDFDFDAQLRITATAGETYYIEAASSTFGPGTGEYDLFVTLVTGGLQTQDLTQGLTAQDLVATLLGANSSIAATEAAALAEVANAAPGEIIVVGDSINFMGAPNAAGTFSGGGGILDSQSDQDAAGFTPFEGGIVLTSGSVSNVIGPNFLTDAYTDNGLSGSADLDSLIPGNQTFDAAVLSFDFVPTVNVVEFSFVFSSEEYNEFVDSGYNDVFGFFVNGVNYARIPETGTYAAGTGEIVSIDSVNLFSNSDFYIDNSYLPSAPYGPLNIEMDGLTVVLTFQAPVLENQVNTITLAIADAGDHIYDSAVFIQEASFQTFTENVDPNVGSAQFQEFINILNQVIADCGGVLDEVCHEIIQQLFINGALKEFDFLGSYALFLVDPVDYIITDPQGNQVVSATSNGGSTVNSSNAFFIGDSTGNQLVILPNAVQGQYSVQLAGVGSGDYLFGGTFVSAAGNVTSVLFSGASGNGGADVAVDFSNPQAEWQISTRDLVALDSGGQTGNGGSSNSTGSGFSVFDFAAAGLRPLVNALATSITASTTANTSSAGSETSSQSSSSETSASRRDFARNEDAASTSAQISQTLINQLDEIFESFGFVGESTVSFGEFLVQRLGWNADEQEAIDVWSTLIESLLQWNAPAASAVPALIDYFRSQWQTETDAPDSVQLPDLQSPDLSFDWSRTLVEDLASTDVDIDVPVALTPNALGSEQVDSALSDWEVDLPADTNDDHLGASIAAVAVIASGTGGWRTRKPNRRRKNT